MSPAARIVLVVAVLIVGFLFAQMAYGGGS